MERYGIIRERPAAVPYEVWPEHVTALNVFIECQTQWRICGDAFVGLDYSVVLEVGRLHGTEDMLQLLRDVQVMEARASDLLNRRQAREARKKWQQT